MITQEDRDNIKQFVNNNIDLNPDAGILTSTKEACEFYGIVLTEDDINTIAFEYMIEIK